jgi:DNA sulfur modification protein DndE
MPDVTLKRVPFSPEADTILRMLKARTGITPNVLCRLGLCLSLDEPGQPRPVDRKLPVAREISRYTLLGEYDIVLIALLRARAHHEGVKASSLDEDFLAHIQRGIQLLSGRVKSLQDFGSLLS